MKKYLIILLTLIIAFTACNGQTQQPTEPEEKNISVTVSVFGTEQTVSIKEGSTLADLLKVESVASAIGTSEYIINVNNAYAKSTDVLVANAKVEIKKATGVGTSEALTNALSGDDAIIKLTADITTTAKVEVTKSKIIDLGGHTLSLDAETAETSGSNQRYIGMALTATEGSTSSIVLQNGTITHKAAQDNSTNRSHTISVGSSVSLTTEDVTIQSYDQARKDDTNGEYYNYIIRVEMNATNASIILKEGTVIKSNAPSGTNETTGTYGVTLFGTATTDGGISGNCSLTVENGVTIDTSYIAITGAGNYHGTTIKIDGDNTTIKSSRVLAIYHPQNGTITITGNPTIEGFMSAIEIRGGELTINGGNFKSTATSFEAKANGSGATVTGAAVAVSQHTTKKSIKVTINNGTFNGLYALYEDYVQEGSAENVTLSITGGEFTGTISDTTKPAPIYSKNCTGFIPTTSTAKFSPDLASDSTYRASSN